VKRYRVVMLLLVACCCTALSFGQIEITLKRQFVDDFADRVTIDASFRVDVTSKIHPASQDGDIHVAGTAPETGLLTVAEVMNAKSEKNQAVKQLVDAAGSGSPVSISGAWRIWSEHGGEQQYVQGEAVPVVTNSGEAHIFEIHPITKVGGRDVGHTWEAIPGFTYKNADDAFTNYERTKSHITEHDGLVTIQTEKSGYNYTEFVAKLQTDPKAIKGGSYVFAAIFDTNGELLVKERRLVFADGTPPQQIISTKHKGDTLDLLGIPRLNLKLVQWRLEHHTGKFANSLDWNLPYELVIAAVLDESPGAPE
jgi:hypothetical protein